MLTSAAFVTPTKPENLHAFRLLKGTRIKEKENCLIKLKYLYSPGLCVPAGSLHYLFLPENNHINKDQCTVTF